MWFFINNIPILCCFLEILYYLKKYPKLRHWTTKLVDNFLSTCQNFAQFRINLGKLHLTRSSPFPLFQCCNKIYGDGRAAHCLPFFSYQHWSWGKGEGGGVGVVERRSWEKRHFNVIDVKYIDLYQEFCRPVSEFGVKFHVMQISIKYENLFCS